VGPPNKTISYDERENNIFRRERSFENELFECRYESDSVIIIRHRQKIQEAVCLENAPPEGAFFLSNILMKEGEYN
jgi:hypothetical protein